MIVTIKREVSELYLGLEIEVFACIWAWLVYKGCHVDTV